MVFNIDLNLYAFVGIIMLVGIVKKNGIMMNRLRAGGPAQRGQVRPPRPSTRGAVRFRPIMMTPWPR